MAATAARRRHRWRVLLASAVVLLVAMFVRAPQFGADPAVDAGASPSPVPPYTPAAAEVPTTFPSTPPAPAEPRSALPVVRLVDLPPEVSRVVDRVDRGVPSGGVGDGSTFTDDAGVLPPRPTGYYRVHPVPTPTSGERGTRRIVVGEGGELYWTAGDDRSLVRVRR